MRLEAASYLTLVNDWRWPDFSPAELASRDNGSLVMETEFLDRLQELRNRFKRPMVVTSGYRHPEENAAKSASGLTGPHTTGRAVDVKVNDAKRRFELVALAIDCGFTGLGIGRNFLHIDSCPVGDKVIPRPAIWTYRL